MKRRLGDSQSSVKRGALTLECGGKRIATPLYEPLTQLESNPECRRRFALPAHSKLGHDRVVVQFERYNVEQ